MAKKILIVDDFVDYTALLEKRLKLEGFETSVAFDGKAGIEKAKALKPDLVILDIMMPEIGGNEVRAELMKDPATENIPIIFLTGLRAPFSKKESAILDVRTIGKSNDLTELIAAIRQVLSA